MKRLALTAADVASVLAGGVIGLALTLLVVEAVLRRKAVGRWTAAQFGHHRPPADHPQLFDSEDVA